MDSLSRTLFRVEVSETSRGRDYWATRPWCHGAAGDAVRSADLVIVPWENFREKNEALFPQGAGDICRDLKADLEDAHITIAVDKEKYKEIALHAHEFRIPTLLVTAVLLPALGQVIGNRVDRWLPGFQTEASVDLEIIVEGSRGRCISIKYKGPKEKLVETILTQTERCLPKVTSDAKPNQSGTQSTRK
jgi:hypothetical protein